MENELKQLTSEELNGILIESVNMQSYDLIDWLLHSKELSHHPTIHKEISPDNPFIICLKNNDIKAIIILVQENVGNKFIRHYESMKKCLEYAAENQMWDMCHFILDIGPDLNPLIAYKYAIVNATTEETLSFYERISDKGKALMCACYHGNEFFYDKSKKENIEFNYDLTFAYIIDSQNNLLLEKFLTDYSDNINWLKSGYFIDKIIDKKNVKNLKYILEHPKIKESFNIDTYGNYFGKLMSDKNSQEAQDMLDYLVFDYVLKFKGLSNYGKTINKNDLEQMEDKLHKRDMYLKIEAKFKEKNIKTKKNKI